MYRDQQFISRAFAGFVLSYANSTIDNIAAEQFYDVTPALPSIEK